MGKEAVKNDEDLPDRDVKEMINKRADYLLGPLSYIELQLNTPVKITGLNGTVYKGLFKEFGSKLSMETTKNTTLSAVSPEGDLIAYRTLRIVHSSYFPLRNGNTTRTELYTPYNGEELIFGYVSTIKNKEERLTTYVGKKNEHGLVDIDTTIGINQAIELFQLSESVRNSSF